MPFTAQCPGCRTTRFRASWKRAGSPMTCPRCDKSFLLYPDDTPTALVDRPVYAAPQLPVRVVAEPEELPAVPQPRLADAPDEGALVMALVALGLVGVAVLASQLPYGRFAAAAVATVGVAVAALGMFGLRALRRLGWAGLGLNGLVLLLVVALPGWLGLTEWLPPAAPKAVPPMVTAVGRDDGMPRPADRVDAARAVWQFGDVRVAVTSVAVGPADAVPGTPPTGRGAVLRVGVKLTNVGVERAIPFRGWVLPAPEVPPRLTVDGKPLPFLAATPDGPATVYPGKTAEAVLTFALPQKAGPLALDLPASAFGGTESVRFLIPQVMAFGQ